jgi:hypothetical protein
MPLSLSVCVYLTVLYIHLTSLLPQVLPYRAVPRRVVEQSDDQLLSLSAPHVDERPAYCAVWERMTLLLALRDAERSSARMRWCRYVAGLRVLATALRRPVRCHLRKAWIRLHGEEGCAVAVSPMSHTTSMGHEYGPVSVTSSVPPALALSLEVEREVIEEEEEEEEADGVFMTRSSTVGVGVTPPPLPSSPHSRIPQTAPAHARARRLFANASAERLKRLRETPPMLMTSTLEAEEERKRVQEKQRAVDSDEDVDTDDTLSRTETTSMWVMLLFLLAGLFYGFITVWSVRRDMD